MEHNTIYREWRRIRKVQVAHDIMGAVGLVGFIVAMGLALWILSRIGSN